jgi:hypothetical protein
MDWKQILLSALVFMVVAQVVHTIGAVLTMGYYTDPAYFPLWSTLMMPAGGPPGAEFYAASFLGNFAIGLIFAWAYYTLKGSIPGKGLNKGVNYGLLLFLLAALPGTLMMLVLLAVPVALLFSWAVESLILYALSGAAFAKLIR